MHNYKHMRKKILLIILVGISFGIKAQEKIQTEVGLKDDFIYKNGSIGIGTTNPQAKLHINGSLMLNNGVIQRGGTPIIITTDLGLYSHLSGHWIRIVSNNAPIRFFTDIGNGGAGKNVKMSIESNGSVGIGTTVTGSHKLAVEGSIGAREIKVESSGWSDYVFDDNYKLQDIKDLENHIKVNKCLPNIPTEEEVTKEGINLGEMDAKLLQKVEELTLYLIEQNKEIERMKEEIRLLKADDK